MSYIRFSDLKFTRKDHAAICKNILQEIQALETQVMLDEEFVDYISNRSGLDPTKVKYMGLNHRMLNSLKMVFWYYTGKDPSSIIIEPNAKDKPVDIFNPLE